MLALLAFLNAGSRSNFVSQLKEGPSAAKILALLVFLYAASGSKFTS